MDREIEKNQFVYLTFKNSDKIEKTRIEKIYRGWIYVFCKTTLKCERFNIDTLKHDNGRFFPAVFLSFSRQEIKNELEYRQLKAYLQNAFRWDSEIELDLKQLRKIYKIVNEEKNQHMGNKR